MVPLSTTTKITSKSGIVNTPGSVYIMNSNAISAVTPSNSSPIMTAKPQSSTEEGQRNVFIIKNEELKSGVPIVNNENNQNLVLLNVPHQKDQQKSSVLSDILKASGVIPEESEITEVAGNNQQEQCDIESQISQLTEIPTSETQKNLDTLRGQEICVRSENKHNKSEPCLELESSGEMESLQLQDENLDQVVKVEMNLAEGETIETAKIIEEMEGRQEIIQFETNDDEIAAISETNIDESSYVVLGELKEILISSNFI